jgi:hypothetical protein
LVLVADQQHLQVVRHQIKEETALRLPSQVEQRLQLTAAVVVPYLAVLILVVLAAVPETHHREFLVVLLLDLHIQELQDQLQLVVGDTLEEVPVVVLLNLVLAAVAAPVVLVVMEVLVQAVMEVLESNFQQHLEIQNHQ